MIDPVRENHFRPTAVRSIDGDLDRVGQQRAATHAEPVVEKLRERARRKHRSLQGELLVLVTQCARSGENVPALSDQESGPEKVSLEEIAADHRVRRPEPVAEGLSSVELIRAERDAR